MKRLRLSVSMSARPVESFRGPWQPLDDAFSDPGVALDFVRSLEPRLGPTVLRVEATGGAARDRESLGGDWLCDPGWGNAAVASPEWDHDHASIAWARRRPLLDAWEECGEAVWLIHAAGLVGAPPWMLSGAAAACAASVAGVCSGPYAEVALAAAGAAARWADGSGDSRRAHEAYAAVQRELSRPRGQDEARDEALRAAAMAAASVGSPWAPGRERPRAAGGAETVYAVAAAEHARQAAATALGRGEAAELIQEMADAVRLRIPTLEVLRCAASTTSRGARAGRGRR